MKNLALIFLLAALLLALPGCQAAADLISPPPTETAVPTATWTALPSPTSIPPTVTPSLTPTPSATPTPLATATPNPAPLPIHFQVLDELWRAVQDNYLYRNFNGVDWNQVYAEFRSKVEAGMSNEQFYQAMDEMVARLGDEHSDYQTPEEVATRQAEFAGGRNYVGIGVYTVSVPESSQVTVMGVFPGSPAQEAGIQLHDNIQAVDGVSVLDEQGNRRDILRGPEGTTSTFTVQTPGQAPRDLSITRRAVSGPIPVSRTLLTTPEGKRVGYILLPTFNDATIGQQVGQALQEFAASGPLDGLILDSRYNPGGRSDVLAETLAYFMNGSAGNMVNREGEYPFTVTGTDLNGSQTVPLVVLVGPDSVSFGEIFPGILKDLGRAYLIGETSSGNVEILYTYNFSDGSLALLAHDTFRPLNQPDQNWEISGIIPDLDVPSRWDQVTTLTDPAIQAALQHFSGQ